MPFWSRALGAWATPDPSGETDQRDRGSRFSDLLSCPLFLRSEWKGRSIQVSSEESPWNESLVPGGRFANAGAGNDLRNHLAYPPPTYFPEEETEARGVQVHLAAPGTLDLKLGKHFPRLAWLPSCRRRSNSDAFLLQNANRLSQGSWDLMEAPRAVKRPDSRGHILRTDGSMEGNLGGGRTEVSVRSGPRWLLGEQDGCCWGPDTAGAFPAPQARAGQPPSLLGVSESLTALHQQETSSKSGGWAASKTLTAECS
ncbi:uncharacterized protein ACOB8E_004035 isoform 1-T7 [Sarcophilus harrisii]